MPSFSMISSFQAGNATLTVCLLIIQPWMLRLSLLPFSPVGIRQEVKEITANPVRFILTNRLTGGWITMVASRWSDSLLDDKTYIKKF